MSNMTKGFLGWCALKKTAGQGTPAVGTQVSFPIAAIHPRNPANLEYPAQVNVAAVPSVKVAGKKTPSVTLTGIPLKASWFAGSSGLNLVSDAIAAAAGFLDSSSNSSEYAVGIHDGSSLRVCDGGKCAQLSLYQSAPSGPILMDMRWVCIYGDSEKGSPTGFSTPSTDAGNLLDVTNVDFAGTATDVYHWRLILDRKQTYQPTCDGTLYMASVETGALSGALRLVQNASAATVPSASCTLKISTGGGAGTGVQLVLSLSRDAKEEDVKPALLYQTNDYALFSSAGAYPVALSTF